MWDPLRSRACPTCATRATTPNGPVPDHRRGGKQRLRPPARAHASHSARARGGPVRPPQEEEEKGVSQASSSSRALRCSRCFGHSRVTSSHTRKVHFGSVSLLNRQGKKKIVPSKSEDVPVRRVLLREQGRVGLAPRGFLPSTRPGGVSRARLLIILLFKCVRSQGPARPRNRMFSLNYFNCFNAEMSTVNNSKSVPCLRRRVSISLGARRIEGNCEQLFFFCLGNKTSPT